MVVVYYSSEITGCTVCTQFWKLRCTAKFLGASCTHAPANFEPCVGPKVKEISNAAYVVMFLLQGSIQMLYAEFA